MLEDEFECSVCGASVNINAKFCPSCGEKFDDDEIIPEQFEKSSKNELDPIHLPKNEEYRISTINNLKERRNK